MELKLKLFSSNLKSNISKILLSNSPNWHSYGNKFIPQCQLVSSTSGSNIFHKFRFDKEHFRLGKNPSNWIRIVAPSLMKPINKFTWWCKRYYTFPPATFKIYRSEWYVITPINFWWEIFDIGVGQTSYICELCY